MSDQNIQDQEPPIQGARLGLEGHSALKGTYEYALNEVITDFEATMQLQEWLEGRISNFPPVDTMLYATSSMKRFHWSNNQIMFFWTFWRYFRTKL